MNQTCEHCGKVFQAKPSHKRKFCSRQCYYPNAQLVHDVCATCGVEVARLASQRSGENIYCSRECSDRSKRTRLEIECRWCSKVFIVTPTEYKNGRRLCSWACRKAEQEDAKHRICEVCSKEFKIRAPSYPSRTCSLECGFELRKRGKYMRCEVCDKATWVMPVHFQIFRFCSMACRGVWQSERMNGSNHPMWRGGVSRLPYPFEWTPELKAAIKQRDGEKCMECGTVDALTVHHIDYDKTNCNPSNLITLCNICNPRANFNRSYWQDRYTSMIANL